MIWQCSKNSFFVRQILKPLGLRTNYKFYSGKNGRIALWQNKSILLTNLDKNYLSFELFWKGWEYYEPQTAILINELLQEKNIFIDIGANIGYFSLAAACHFPSLKIFSFEPNPKLQEIFQENISINKHTITYQPHALSDKTENQTFYIPESDMSGTLEATFNEKFVKKITVPTLTLDDALSCENLNGAILLKIDTEGHEPAVIHGGKKILETYTPEIILEVTKDFDKEILHWLKTIGYSFYQIGSTSLKYMDNLSLIHDKNFIFLNFLLTHKHKNEVRNLSDKVYSQCKHISLKDTCLFRPQNNI